MARQRQAFMVLVLFGLEAFLCCPTFFRLRQAYQEPASTFSPSLLLVLPERAWVQAKALLAV
jgi:hypothetical protein